MSSHWFETIEHLQQTKHCDVSHAETQLPAVVFPQMWLAAAFLLT